MINVNAFCFGYLGVQKHGFNFIESLSRHTDIALLPWDPPPPPGNLPAAYKRFLENAEKDCVGRNVGIGIGVMNRMPHIVGERKIAYTVWESSRIPENELACLDESDEIWIPSSWGKSVLEANGIASDRIAVVPEGVDVRLYRPMKNDRDDLRRKFRFLCVGKWEKRKGIDVLLHAYAEAFDTNEPVELVLHCHNANAPELNIEGLIDGLELPPHPRIVHSSPVTEVQMPHLYNSCDVFVLATRGEGWGLPVIEAMACAKPVIVTNHGACLDFVNSGNAYLVDVKAMVHVDDGRNFDPSLDFGEWAEPDQDHLACLLRHVFENRDEAKRVGEVAGADIAGAWTWDHAAAKAWNLLQKQPL